MLAGRDSGGGVVATVKSQAQTGSRVGYEA